MFSTLLLLHKHSLRQIWLSMIFRITSRCHEASFLSLIVIRNRSVHIFIGLEWILMFIFGNVSVERNLVRFGLSVDFVIIEDSAICMDVTCFLRLELFVVDRAVVDEA